LIIAAVSLTARCTTDAGFDQARSKNLAVERGIYRRFGRMTFSNAEIKDSVGLWMR
jgi:hypothetical protein